MELKITRYFKQGTSDKVYQAKPRLLADDDFVLHPTLDGRRLLVRKTDHEPPGTCCNFSKEVDMDHPVDANKMVAIGLLLEKADAKLNTKAGYQSNQLRQWFDSLMNRGTVEVGWRESCGTTDPTAKIRAEWVKVTKRLQKAGIHFTVERVKHNNGWATKCGGFWHSEIFTIPTVKESLAARTTEHLEVQTK